jgi:predicted nucleic acid-binding protein
VVLVDTSVWVDYFNGSHTPEADLLDGLLGTGELLIGDLILAELLQGFARDADFRRARRLLLELPCAELVGREVALTAAANYRALRQVGVTVRKTVDLLIATHCVRYRHELLHADRDFDGFEQHLGLRVWRGWEQH